MLHIQLDDQVSPRLRELLNNELPAERTRMTSQLLAQTLNKTRELNPVRTGRSRAGWVTAEEQAVTSESATTTQLHATNTVPYIVHLEYGTSRMRPRSMLRRALSTLRQQVVKFFRLD